MLVVKSGWQGFREVNRVVYDPRRVTVAQMVDMLKKSGTFISTLAEEEPRLAPLHKRNGRP